eukprot:TRINITY_DN774237_c0_g1_i1.p1 TRINITY_DN774237_c0_g1~~TRINITY_DN774237_c0_g1_i1.p1  ORF type:complete len:513 (+),score=157.05 TRINITY_DN774237_c0_g1_i1:27-1565(+)
MERRSRSRSRSPIRERRPMHKKKRGEPLKTYKQFINDLPDDMAPEEYASKYAHYKREWNQSASKFFFEAHKSDEWFVEKYAPKQRMAKRQAQRDHAKSAVNVIFEKLENQDETFDFTSAFKRDRSERCERTVVLPNIPSWVTNAALTASLTDCPDFDLHFSSCSASEGYHRRAFLVFENKEDSDDILNNDRWRGLRIENERSTMKDDEGEVLKDSFILTAQSWKPLPSAVNRCAAAKERIVVDLEQAIKLSRSFDNEHGLNSNENGIDKLIESEFFKNLDEMKKLDLIREYLLTVHLCSYYTAKRYNSVGEQMDDCPLLEERPESNEEDSSDWENWGKLLDEKIEKTFESMGTWGQLDEEDSEDAKRADESVPEIEEKFVEERVLADDPEKTDEADRHRCALCSKLFSGKKFVRKHLIRKHKSDVEQAASASVIPIMKERYNKDPNRPLPQAHQRKQRNTDHHHHRRGNDSRNVLPDPILQLDSRRLRGYIDLDKIYAEKNQPRKLDYGDML